MLKKIEDHLRYEIEIPNNGEFTSEFYSIASYLKEKLQFELQDPPSDCLNVTYILMHKEDVRLMVGLDIWSGVFVMASCDKGDIAIQEIAAAYDEWKSTRPACEPKENVGFIDRLKKKLNSLF